MMCSLRIGDCLRCEALAVQGFPPRFERLAACTRASVNDVVSSRADDRAAAPPRAAADSAPVSAAPTSLLPPADALDDGVITARIRADLLLDPAMTGSDVSVNTEDGVMRVDDHLAIDLR